jgi:hypothetical protein
MWRCSKSRFVPIAYVEAKWAMKVLHFTHTYPNLPHTICSILAYLRKKQTQILKSSIHSRPPTRNQHTENSSAATSAPIFNVHAPQPLTTMFTSYVFFKIPSWWNTCTQIIHYVYHPCSASSFVFGVLVDNLWFDFQMFERLINLNRYQNCKGQYFAI